MRVPSALSLKLQVWEYRGTKEYRDEGHDYHKSLSLGPLTHRTCLLMNVGRIVLLPHLGIVGERGHDDGPQKSARYAAVQQNSFGRQLFADIREAFDHSKSPDLSRSFRRIEQFQEGTFLAPERLDLERPFSTSACEEIASIGSGIIMPTLVRSVQGSATGWLLLTLRQRDELLYREV
jgi:hypothetical protein